MSAVEKVSFSELSGETTCSCNRIVGSPRSYRSFANRMTMPNTWRLEDDSESEDDDEIWLKRSLASNSAYLALLGSGTDGAGPNDAEAEVPKRATTHEQQRIGENFTTASLQRSIELRKSGVDELWVLSPTAVLQQQTQGMLHCARRQLPQSKPGQCRKMIGMAQFNRRSNTDDLQLVGHDVVCTSLAQH